MLEERKILGFFLWKILDLEKADSDDYAIS